MASDYGHVDEKLSSVKPASKTSFCQRNKSENGSFVSKLRDHLHEFIHASMDEHKTCLRNTFQKIIVASKNFRKDGGSLNEGESSLSLESPTRSDIESFLES